MKGDYHLANATDETATLQLTLASQVSSRVSRKSSRESSIHNESNRCIRLYQQQRNTACVYRVSCMSLHSGSSQPYPHGWLLSMRHRSLRVRSDAIRASVHGTANAPCQLIDRSYACPFACPASTNSCVSPKSKFDIHRSASVSFVSRTDSGELHSQSNRHPRLAILVFYACHLALLRVYFLDWMLAWH